MDTETEFDTSMSTTTDGACDLCGCLKDVTTSPPIPNSVHEFRLATQAIQQLCQHVTQMTSSMDRGPVSTSFDREGDKAKLRALERDCETLRARITHLENAVEVKRILLNSTRDLFDKLSVMSDIHYQNNHLNAQRTEQANIQSLFVIGKVELVLLDVADQAWSNLI
ncbi:uncharacterized protein BP01DRAFT_411658 [Aspergillus saccharolyticus JOP 1030-1]|uniref:Uncharacterized protein n=1 Tax=Aspergillus saccharolyticus JOP 1030-1 TaxID=1450539 RepID=A0A318Z1C5_9EURO|nr:hypothetical protein BP01DRAFT_411658 [Aspergillus saccharolyticus JOP 1030-1]PYH40087.1 hypothetical protein BP01DRAFT_411658 [Aspergillus saccharolyticus JOP 1030-1]